jgi:hypothetical protein
MTKSKSQPATQKKTTKTWSSKVTAESHALDLEKGVFTRPPHEIALSLKRSAEQSSNRKASPFRSAMSMLTFYQNRAGNNLTKAQLKSIEAAKIELRKLFGRDDLNEKKKK